MPALRDCAEPPAWKSALATHPGITIGVTPEVWRGPVTTRVQAVTVGHVPPVDVLVCGPDLTYTDRAQIVSQTAGAGAAGLPESPVPQPIHLEPTSL